MDAIPARLSFLLLCWTAAWTLPLSGQLFLLAVLAVFGRSLPGFRPFSPASGKIYVRFLIYAGTLTTIVVLLNGLFIRSGTAALVAGNIHLYSDGMMFGLRVSARLVIMSSAILLFFVSTPLRSFSLFLESVGTPRVITSVLLLSLEYIERLPARVDQIFTAQEARGAPVRASFIARSRSLVAVIGPLILSSLVESIDRSHALALRGFQHRPADHSLPPPRMNAAAWIFLCVSFLLVAWSAWQSLIP